MKRREWIRLVVVAASLAFAAAAHAQTVGVGTTKGGATAQVSAALAKVVSANSGMQMRPQPMGGTQQYIPLVNSGELEFGISNMMQAYMAFSGTGLSKGSRHDNLRLVSTLMVFRIGVFVRSDSGIKSVADLKGKRVPSEYTSAPLFHHLMTAFLANGGLEWKDVQPVPQAALAPHWGGNLAGQDRRGDRRRRDRRSQPGRRRGRRD
ncbi:MAG: TAXI family TRAP transporter solute-binding subunit [Burkholderiales bacterium]|nr:TAXI family TRAP transporter solute-binding subunit [Burkholderiales bacterium]